MWDHKARKKYKNRIKDTGKHRNGKTFIMVTYVRGRNNDDNKKYDETGKLLPPTKVKSVT